MITLLHHTLASQPQNGSFEAAPAVLRLPALEIACDVRACLRDQGIGRGSLTGPLMHYVSTGRIKAQVWASWESE